MYRDFTEEFSPLMNALTHVEYFATGKGWVRDRVVSGDRVRQRNGKMKESRKILSLSLSFDIHFRAYSLLAFVLSMMWVWVWVCISQLYYYSSFALKSISRTNVFLQLNFKFNTLSLINSWLLFCISSIPCIFLSQLVFFLSCNRHCCCDFSQHFSVCLFDSSSVCMIEMISFHFMVSFNFCCTLFVWMY